MRILTLANRQAAGGRALTVLDAFLIRQTDAPHEFVRSAPASIDEMRARIRSAREDAHDAVLLVGGDGTLHAALPALLEADIPFGLLPVGRGNDFARAVGIRSAAGALSYNADGPRSARVHIPRVNGTPFATVASLGFDATVGRLAQQRKGWFPGSLGYLTCVFRALPEWRPFKARITVDDEVWTGRVVAIAVANSTFYGGGFRVAPSASPSESELHVVVLEELSKRELVRLIPALFKGTHTSHPRIRLLRGRQIQVEADGEQDLLADGEWPGAESSVTWTAGEDWLELLLPD